MAQEPENRDDAASPEADPAQSAPAPAPRRVWPTILYLALLAAGVLAAWQVHLFWQSRRRGDLVGVDPYKPDPVKNHPSLWAKMKPSELASRPWPGAGIRKMLKESPADLPRISGARFRGGIERVQDGYAYRHASYRFDGAAADAASQYVEMLKAKGFELIRDAAPRTARSARTLTFSSAGEGIVVSLRPGGGKDGIITIRVTASCPVR